ncbi:MAG: alkyl hydroperoxide reductase [Bacteroidetes bacterium]|nr:MAG: alkyl hydroperoxide reductase [Bacteroidota bacterium]
MPNFSQRTITSIFCLLFTFTAFSQDSLFIKGRITGSNTGNQTLALSDIVVAPPVSVTTITGKDGSFSFTVPSSPLSIYRLYLSGENFIMLLVTGESIDLELNAEKLNLNPVIRGSEDTRILYDIAVMSSAYDKKLDSLNKAYGEARGSEQLQGRIPVIQAAYEQAVNEQKTRLKQALTTYPASPASLFFIDKLEIDTDLGIYSLVAGELYSKYPAHKLVADLKLRVDLEKELQPGKPAPEINLPDMDGKPVKLSSLRGKIVMIDFWASWCSPCRRENPEVVRIYNRFKDKGFDIYGVSLDRDANGWFGAIAKDGLVWTQVSDLKYWESAGAKAYGVKAIPHTVLINREGKIIARKLRGKALEDKLEELLGKD